MEKQVEDVPDKQTRFLFHAYVMYLEMNKYYYRAYLYITNK